jgi:hypothetical protein
MAGSTFIYETDEAKFENFDMDRMDEFDTVDMNFLTTIDFSIITGEAGVNWTDGEPLKLDEESGIVILRVDEAGLKCLLNFKGSLENIQEEEMKQDIDTLREFISRNGTDNIYELATF